MRTLLITLAALAALPTLPASAATCESLAAVALPDGAITTTGSVPAGTFTPPYGNAIDKLPAFCRVTGVLKPTPDSYIRFEESSALSIVKSFHRILRQLRRSRKVPH